MKESYKPYARYGHRFQDKNGQVYVSIDFSDAKELQNAETMRVVKAENKKQWELLTAWRRNKVHADTPAWETDDLERQSYEMVMPMADLEPIDEVRFITSHYKDKFKVKSGGQVTVNGTAETVIYIDQTHMFIGDLDSYMRCYHICEYAELCEMTGAVVEPIA